MKITLALLLALSTAPAYAHSGAHIHPHGDTGLPVLAGLAAIALAAFLGWRSR
ncbi:MAG: hypothetical protein AB8B58_16160 [Roseobacter sp.]